jgi:hypothetical protein
MSSERERALRAGRAAERIVGTVVDRAESVALWALERAAEGDPHDERLDSAERRLRQLRSMAAPLPRNAGRAVAASSYFGMRWLPEIVGSARQIARETSAFLHGDDEARGA